MIKTFQIDFVRQLLESTLDSIADENSSLYYSASDISIFSFYEHLQTEEEVDRYVERYQDLVNEQNRAGTIGIGVLTTPTTPTITNIRSSFVSPFEWTCAIRFTLGNRDMGLATIYKVIETLKGRVNAVAQLNDGTLVFLGVIGRNGELEINDYDYIGVFDTDDTSTSVETLIANYTNNGFTNNATYLYGTDSSGILYLLTYDSDSDTWTTEIVNDNTGCDIFKLSCSFDDIKCDQPYVLNANEYCTITFGGSATLSSANITMGNDISIIQIGKYKIVTSNDSSNDIWLTDDETSSGDVVYTILEPLEITSGNNLNANITQLRSNYFKQNTHIDSISPVIQYAFVYDSSISILKQWFEFGRYGSGSNSTISPNMIYMIKEYICGIGELDVHTFQAKVSGDIEIENTESDTLTISIAFQVQGENH